MDYIHGFHGSLCSFLCRLMSPIHHKYKRNKEKKLISIKTKKQKLNQTKKTEIKSKLNKAIKKRTKEKEKLLYGAVLMTPQSGILPFTCVK